MNKKNAFIVLAIIGLIAVRLIGARVFYDPLIAFFHQADYQLQELPEIVYWKYMVSLFIRFAINTTLTLILVKLIFDNNDLTKLTLVILALAIAIFVPVLLYFMNNGDFNNYHYLFYVRRMLIHPVLTLILIPAFLYHQRSFKK
jgi:exosortase F-associated protein